MSPIYCFLHCCSCCEFNCKNTDSNKLVMVLKLWFRFVLSNGDNYFLTSHDTCICSSRGTKVTFWGAADGAGGLREEGWLGGGGGGGGAQYSYTSIIHHVHHTRQVVHAPYTLYNLRVNIAVVNIQHCSKLFRILLRRFDDDGTISIQVLC